MTELAEWLTSPAGAAAMQAAEQVPAGLAGAEALRRALPDATAAEVSAALTQVDLRRQAATRYGVTTPLLLTRDGLEQATRPELAAARATVLSGAHPRRLIDATAGLGFDAMALVATGIPVLAIERDPATAVLLAANVPGAIIACGDVRELLPTDLSHDDIVFLDPARRDARRSADGSRAQPERDPERWSPPWSFVLDLAKRTRVCVKTAPGWPPAQVPPGWCAQWTTVQRTPTEACLFSWAALPTPREAVAVGHEGRSTLGGIGLPVGEIGGVGEFLHEVDPSVVNAGLVDDLIEHVNSAQVSSTGAESGHDRTVHRIDAQPHWLSGGHAASSPFLRSYRVCAELPIDHRAMRAALLGDGIEQVTVKTRGSRTDAERVRRQLRLPGGPSSAIIVVTQVAGREAAYRVETA